MSIWKDKELRSQFPEGAKLITLNEGETSVVKKTINNQGLLIINEETNPSGSWKDRGTSFKLTQLLSDNINEAVLFSSGNALISLLTYCNELKLDFKVHCVVSEKVNKIKLGIIQSLVKDKQHTLVITSQPKKKAIEISAQLKIPNLRISLDNEIVKGYWSLGFEINSLIKNEDNSSVNIYCPASSGTALVGLVQGIFMKVNSESKMPRIFVCQTDALHTFDNENKVIEKNSLADAIVDTVGLRSGQVQKIVRETNGEIYSISNGELKRAKEFCIESGLQKYSYNSLLSIAGYLRGSTSRINICVASGR